MLLFVGSVGDLADDVQWPTRSMSAKEIPRIYTMKELVRLVGYTAATLAMVFLVIGIAKAGVSPEVLAYSAIFVVVVLPVVIGILMARREKRNTANQ